MPDANKLTSLPLVAFVPISDKDKALAFYVDQLGLKLIADQSPFALELDANGTTIRATFAGEFTPQQFTVLGWRVEDIEGKTAELAQAGVVFNKYPWAGDHPQGIWTAPGGTRIAWFQDPFGNVLSLQQDPAA
jgi:catechol 2,3-dioxygenase-like lactoylglutathione lyase family enzyme